MQKNNTSEIQTAPLFKLEDGYPTEFTAHPRWVGFKKQWNEERQKFNKIPYYLNDVGHLVKAKINDPSHFMSFQSALHLLKEDQVDGIGIVLPEHIICIDIDSDPEGVIFKQVSAQFPATAMEVSISGKGFHLFINGNPPANMGVKSKQFYDSQVEVFGKGRFIALSGRFNGLPIAQAEQELQNFVTPLIKSTSPNLGAGAKIVSIHQPQELLDTQLLDIVEKAKQGKDGQTFKQLFEQGWVKSSSIFPSPSEADMHFCSTLAFWCQKDASLMDRIFRLSALMRDKWDEVRGIDTYGAITLQTAIKGCTNVYNPLYYFDRAMEAENLNTFVDLISQQNHSALIIDGWEQRNATLRDKAFQFLNAKLHDVMCVMV